MTAAEFLDAATEVNALWPNAIITHNPVGGLSVDVDGKFVGWIDTTAGELKLPGEKP